MSRKFANRASERGYRWRMFDASLRELDRKRPPFQRLPAKIAIAAARAKFAGFLREPNKVNRHFAVLSAEMLDARRTGLNPRILAGRGL